MDEWMVHPWEGLGDLRFGTPRATVRAMLGDEFRSFRRGPTPSDDYEQLGIQLSYDDNDCLEFIEIYPPILPTYKSIALFGDLDLILGKMAALGHTPRQDDGGYFFDQLGICLYVPHDKIAEVAVYRKGYYDK